MSVIQCMPCSSRIINEMLSEINTVEEHYMYFLKQIIVLKLFISLFDVSFTAILKFLPCTFRESFITFSLKSVEFFIIKVCVHS